MTHTKQKLDVVYNLARREKRALGQTFTHQDETTLLWELIVLLGDTKCKKCKSPLDEYIIHLGRMVGQLEHLTEDKANG